MTRLRLASGSPHIASRSVAPGAASTPRPAPPPVDPPSPKVQRPPSRHPGLLGCWAGLLGRSAAAAVIGAAGFFGVGAPPVDAQALEQPRPIAQPITRPAQAPATSLPALILAVGPNPSEAPVPMSVRALDPAVLPALGATATPAERAQRLAGLALSVRRSRAETTRDLDGSALIEAVGALVATKPSSPSEAKLLEAMMAVLEPTQGPQLNSTLRALFSTGSLGLVAEALGLARLYTLFEARGLPWAAVNDLLSGTDTVHLRGPTTSEVKTLRALFGQNFDLKALRYHFADGLQTLGAQALVTGNVVHVGRWKDWGFAPGTTRPLDPTRAEAYDSTLLAHEPTHVRDFQRLGWSVMLTSLLPEQLAAVLERGGRAYAYFYRFDRPSITDYGVEQRAMIVQDYEVARLAAARGDPLVKLPGLLGGPVKPSAHVARAAPYLRQLAALPAQPERAGVEGGEAEAVVRALNLLASAMGASAVDELTSGDGASALFGLGKVGAAFALSLMPGSAAGSDVLDQLGVPTGVAVRDEGGGLSARLRWEGGFKDPLVEVRADAEGPDARLGVGAQLGLDGQWRSVDAGVSLETPEVRADGAFGLRFGLVNLSYGRVSLGTLAAVVSIDGSVHWVPVSGQVLAASVGARADFALGQGAVSAEATARFGQGMRFESSELSLLWAQGSSDAAFRLRLLPAGVDALGLDIGQRTATGTIALDLAALDLTTAPRLLGTLSIAGQDGSSFSVEGAFQPSTGGASIRVGALIPIGGGR